MIPGAVRGLVVLFAMALLGGGCSLEATSPEQRWQKTYDKAFVEQSGKKWEKAQASYESALVIARKIDPKGKRAADTLLPLGELAIRTNEPDKAIAYLLEAKAIYERLWNPELGGVNNRDNAIYLARILLNYGTALYRQKKLNQAQNIIKKARHIAEVAPAPDHVTHEIMSLQSKIAKALGQAEASEKLSDGANLFDTPVDGKNADDTRNMTWQQLVEAGDEAVAALNFDNANTMYEKAKNRLERDNQGGFALGRVYLSMGILYDTRREYEKAERALTKALRILRVNEALPARANTRYYTSEAMERLAAVLNHTNRLEQARELYQQTIEIERRLKHDNNFRRRERRLMEALADVYKKSGQYPECQRLLKEKIAIELPLYGNKTKKLGYNYRELGNVCVLAGQNAEAAEYFDQSMKVLERCPDVNPGDKLEVYDSYATVLEKMGKSDQAMTLRKKAEDLETSIVKQLHL